LHKQIYAKASTIFGWELGLHLMRILLISLIEYISHPNCVQYRV
jgi:hypothetical protein